MKNNSTIKISCFDGIIEGRKQISGSIWTTEVAYDLEPFLIYLVVKINIENNILSLLADILTRIYASINLLNFY